MQTLNKTKNKIEISFYIDEEQFGNDWYYIDDMFRDKLQCLLQTKEDYIEYEDNNIYIWYKESNNNISNLLNFLSSKGCVITLHEEMNCKKLALFVYYLYDVNYGGENIDSLTIYIDNNEANRKLLNNFYKTYKEPIL